MFSNALGNLGSNKTNIGVNIFFKSNSIKYPPVLTCSFVLTWRKCSQRVGKWSIFNCNRRRRSANSLFSRCATVRCLTTTGKGTGRLEAEAPDARRSRQSAGSDAAAAGSELGGRGGVVGRRAVGRRALGAVARAADDGGDICVWDGPAAREHLGLHGRPRRPRLRRAHACLGGGRLRGYGGTTLSTRLPRADHLPAVVAGAGARARAHSVRPGDARVEPRPRTAGC